MASTSFQNVSHGEYDAFLSFRGEDTRKGFIGHLYTALNNKGIYVFKDDKQLEKGGSISPNLLKAIEESRISIIVLSKNYASSTWCLDELVKIVECKNRDNQIFPIFYDVEPTVVRKQTTTFGEAFAKHEEFFRDNIKKVQKWRHALKVVANISGWELKDRNESEFIEEIVNVISSQIRSEPEILKELVGMESRLEKLRFLMGTGSNDVRMIGIWGMGGLGKTTLARVVYDLMSHEFDGSSFLADVREKCDKEGSVISLQKQLLSDLLKLADNSIPNVYDGINMLRIRLRRKKVLVVIDDVADVEQLQRLVGRRDWFGPGSRILITTRDKQLLVAHEVDEEHILNLDVLNNDEALQLFSMKAFKTHQPVGEYVELSERVLEYAGSLPLALKVLGSFLIGRSTDLWRSALERLKKDPSNKIMSILQISFEGLQDSEKKIFLDVACFFKLENRDDVTKILEGCGFSPVIGIEVLIEKSLLTVDGRNRLGMHDLLQELGQLIVTRQSPEEPGKRSRIWREEEVREVLTNNTGSQVVEGIMVDDYFFRGNDVHLSAKAFSLMTNLRLLKISNVQLPEGLEYLSNELRLLDWHRYPLKSLPSNLQLDKTVDFKMCYSRIEELWKGIKPLNMLRVLKLSHSENLIKTPDFTKVPNLKVLDLEGCKRLREIHPSLLRHNKLILLNMKGCTSLTTLPGKIFMESLKTLVLSGCSKLKKFPDIVMRSMGDLTELFLDGTSIAEVPSKIELLTGLKKLDISGTAIRQPSSSIFLMKNLKELSCRGCKGSPSSTSWFLRFPINLMRWSSDPVALNLPSSLSGLCSLTKLDISYCDLGEGAIPSSIGDLCSLKELYLSGNNFFTPPASIYRLSNLLGIFLEDCRNLETLPITVSSLKCLRTLKLSGCSKIVKFPESVISIEDLSELFLDRTPITEVPSSIELLTKLQLLNLNDCRSLVRLPNSINGLKSLKTLNLSGCFKLENVPETLGQIESLKKLDISGTAISNLHSQIFLMKNLKELHCRGCIGSPSSASRFLRFPINLMRWSSDPVALSLPSSLSGLSLPSSLSGLSLPSSLSGLCTKLDISYCDLREGAIPSGIGNLCSLKELNLSGNNFFTLPASIYRLSSLLDIDLKECKMLQNLPRLPGNIRWISLDGCVSLGTLSDVFKLNEHRLRYLHLRCMDCLKLAGNYDLALSLLKECIENSEVRLSLLPVLTLCLKLMQYMLCLFILFIYSLFFSVGLRNMSLLDKYIKKDHRRRFDIIVPGSEIPEWFEYQNNEGSSITISTPPKTYKNSKLVGYAMCCVFHVPKYSLPYYIRPLPYPVHYLRVRPTDVEGFGFYFRKQFGQAVSDHLWLYYLNREDISKVKFDSPSGLELKRCGLHPIYVHEGDKFNQTIGPVWRLNEFGHDCSGSTSFTRSLNYDLDRAEASGSCCGDDAGSTTSSERSFLKRSLEGYVGAAEASGSGCCNDEEEPQTKRFRQLE